MNNPRCVKQNANIENPSQNRLLTVAVRLSEHERL